MVKDPVNVPSLTEYILSKLRSVSPEEDEQIEASSSTSNNIYPSSPGSATLDQEVYRKQLLSGHLFALQDLDLGLVKERWDEIKDKDWRRLVRRLARYENFYAGEGGSGILGELHDAPIGLKNRMRVVKIIQGILTGT